MRQLQLNRLVLLRNNSRLQQSLKRLQHILLHIIISLLESTHQLLSMRQIQLLQQLRSRLDDGLYNLQSSSSDLPTGVVIIIISPLVVFELGAPAALVIAVVHLVVVFVVVGVVGVVADQALGHGEDVFDVGADLFGTLFD